MEALFTSIFRRFVKKQTPPFQLAIQDEVDRIIAAPNRGEDKKADLTGYRIQRFRFNQQEYLVAYEVDGGKLLFVMIGTHENFYRDLKNYLRESRK